MPDMKKQKKAGRPPKFPKADGEDRSMKRFQVSFSPDLFTAIEKFRAAQPFHVERSDIIAKVVERFLASEGYIQQE